MGRLDLSVYWVELLGVSGCNEIGSHWGGEAFAGF
jgi:hypothetical protein